MAELVDAAMRAIAASGNKVAARGSPAIQRQILSAFIVTAGDERARVLAAFAVLRQSGAIGSGSADHNPTRRLLFAAGLIARV